MTAALVAVLLALAAECSAVSTTFDCPFETDFCLWTQDQGTDKFDWNLIPWTAQVGAGPTGDHTTGKGHYIHVGSSVGANGDNAQLTSPLLTIPRGQSKCLLFYYTMYGEHVNDLNVYWKTSATRNRIWTRHGNQGTDWMEARLHLPEATPFQVVIEAVRGDGEKGDIFIDDIKLIDGPCSPPAPKPVTCSFDNDMCSWTQMKNDNFDWTRNQGSTTSYGTGPTGDHTTGKGYYLYTEVSGQTANKTARIQSKAITPRLVTQCLSFWYHMHGVNIGTLHVYIKSTQTIGSPIWTKTGAQGLTWKQAAVTVVEGHTPYSVVIEAVTAGGYGGDIAIDDVLLADNPCPVQPTDHTIVHSGQVVRKCEFEHNSFCGYTQDSRDNFDWMRASGTTSSYDTGPSYDHTYGTRSGHYLYYDASYGIQGDIARILTPTYHDGQAMCVKFYYHMYGSSMGTLNVYVKVGNNKGRPLYSRSGDQGNRWRVGQATIPASSGTSASGYQVVFEGVRGRSYQSDIALDDISFTVGVCPTPGDCTFESGLCHWSNTNAGDQFDWIMGSGATSTSNTGPSVDHTLGTGQGSYLYIETSAPRLTGDKARLVSETFPPSPSGSCISFWYNMYGATVGSLNVYITAPGQTDMIWHQSGNHSNYWLVGQAPIPAMLTSYTIVLEGVRGVSYLGDIAIDDITVRSSNCAIFPPDAAAVPQTTAQVTTQSAGKASFSCDFQIDLCGWIQMARTDFSDWTRRHGSTAGTGLSTDHTFGNSYGFYIVSEPSSVSGKTRDKSRLLSPMVQAGQKCITFWYNMYGSNVSGLNVYVQTGIVIPSTPTWKRTGTQGTHWLMGQFSVNVKLPFNVVIEGVSGGSQGVTAIDDVTIANGSCSAGTTVGPSSKPADDKCTFEDSSLCGFSQDISDDFDWTRHEGFTSSSGTGPGSDHTYGTRLGHYMYIETSAPRRPSDVARLNSFILSGATSPSCLTFWYHMYGSSIGTLNVYILRNGVKNSIWQLSGNQGNSWKVAKVSLNTVSSNTPYQIVFEATVGAGYEGDIAIDDFSVTVGACSSDVVLNASRPTVTQKRTTSTAPKSTTDTIPTPKPTVIPKAPRTTVTERPTTTTAPQSTAHTKPTPKPTGTTVGPTSKPADDKCTFEDSLLCGFSQDISDDFDWTRHEGFTSSYGTGPSSDHTYGTRLGHYMYIETSAPRRPSDVARLNSFTLTGPTSPSCLTFWYHMYGSSIGTLNVYILRNGVLNSIWQLSGNQGNSWKVAKVSLNTVSSNTPYQIVFEATVGAGFEDDIAIDDFSVTTGACSSDVTSNVARPTVTQKPTNTTAPQFTTNTKPTGTTVGPMSKPADNKCTFEDSILCGFSQDLSDDFDWTRHEGLTASAGTGPSSDHTYGTISGHYMYIESSEPRRPSDVARLNSFILTGTTSPSCLTFWYHMYGSSIGTLNVYILRNSVKNSIWQLSGNQGNTWKVAKVSLNTVSSNTPYQIVFEGTVGAGYEGDIAIDDFSVTTGACSSDVILNASRPTVTQKPTTTTAPQSTTDTKTTPKPAVIPKATRPIMTQKPTKTSAPQTTTEIKPTPKPTDS